MPDHARLLPHAMTNDILQIFDVTCFTLYQYYHLKRQMTKNISHVLQERGEGSTGEHSQGLLQSLNLRLVNNLHNYNSTHTPTLQSCTKLENGCGLGNLPNTSPEQIRNIK